MTLKKKTGGAFVDVAAVKRRASGAWVAATFVRRRISGAWVDVLATATAALSNQYVTQTGAITTGTRAGIRVNTSGALEHRNSSSYSTAMTWLLSSTSANHEAMASGVSGTALLGSATGSYISCDTSPEWSITDSVIDGTPADSTFTLTIRNKTTLATVSATITLDSERV